MPITKDDINKAIEKFPCQFEDRNGHRFIGETVSGVPARLRDAGWKRVSRQYSDSYHLKRIGCEIRTAQYVGGARPTGRFVEVVYAREPR